VVRLRKSQQHAVVVALAPRECAFGRLLGPGRVMRAQVLDPSGKRSLRRFASRVGGPLELDFCVELAGRYQLVISAEEAGSYTLELERVLARPTPASAQPTAAGAPLASPRLSRLRAELATDPGALDRFWRELQPAGTPLIEPSDADNVLVTFLYRGAPGVSGVSISWPMWSGTFSQPSMARFWNTELFYRTVKLPKATRFSYQLAIDPPREPGPVQELGERTQRAVSRADPYNLHPMTLDPALDAYQQRSMLVLPDAPEERFVDEPRDSKLPHGRLQRERIASKLLDNTHALHVYLPPGHRSGGAYPLVIFFDGEQYLDELRTPQLLDRMIAARAIPPLVAAFVYNAGPDSRDQELPCNPRFAEFVATELLPWLRARYAARSEPRSVCLAGSSFGGLAASYIALEYPGLFGKVLSQSGSYWWSFARGHASYDGSAEPGWLRRRYQMKPRASIELYLSAGTFETAAAPGGVLEHNRLQRDALRALGYTVAYQELVAGHDLLSWRASLPDALIALFPPAP
jgi:enterochelin esterase family protein